MSNEPRDSPLEIDKIIHEPARLQIMTQLYVVDEADFIYLMRQTGLTWGNLSSHMSRLEDAEYINIKKEFREKKPHTILSMTKAGRVAFEKYRKMLDKVFEDLPK
ncbi:MAG: transcriptional regulator [Candidatus Thorarchaeota archaeon]